MSETVKDPNREEVEEIKLAKELSSRFLVLIDQNRWKQVARYVLANFERKKGG